MQKRGVITIVDGGVITIGVAALGRQMVFETGRTPVVCGIGSCA